MLYDFLFELTEFSKNEGELILCEEENAVAAYHTLIDKYGFLPEEIRFIERVSVEVGEMLGYDTY